MQEKRKAAKARVSEMEEEPALADEQLKQRRAEMALEEKKEIKK